jgi:C1A family cysteine protease
MKTTLVTVGPIFGTITVYADFLKWTENSKSGPYKKTNSEFIGGHAIEIVGYCDINTDTRYGYNSTGYWICKNTWGTKWPAGSPLYPGYFTIEMGKNICGIESRCGIVEPDISIIIKNKNISWDNWDLFRRHYSIL